MKDHTVLVNLAELCGQALPLRPDLLHTWAPRLWREVSLWAPTHPQVSAWYNLALLLVREGGHQSTETQRIAISFFTEVLANVFSFTEELQLSCYQLLLSLSPSCVSSLLGPVLAGVMRLSCSQDGTLAYLQEWLLSLAAAPHTATRHRAMELFFLLRRSSPLDCEAVLARREGGVPGFLSKVLG